MKSQFHYAVIKLSFIWKKYANLSEATFVIEVGCEEWQLFLRLSIHNLKKHDGNNKAKSHTFNTLLSLSTWMNKIMHVKDTQNLDTLCSASPR